MAQITICTHRTLGKGAASVTKYGFFILKTFIFLLVSNQCHPATLHYTSLSFMALDSVVICLTGGSVILLKPLCMVICGSDLGRKCVCKVSDPLIYQRQAISSLSRHTNTQWNRKESSQENSSGPCTRDIISYCLSKLLNWDTYLTCPIFCAIRAKMLMNGCMKLSLAENGKNRVKDIPCLQVQH